MTASVPKERGDGQIFQLSSGSIYRMTRDHFHAFLSLGFQLKTVLKVSRAQYFLWMIFVLSLASAGERNACLRQSANQTSQLKTTGIFTYVQRT